MIVRYLIYGENNKLLYYQEIKKYGGDAILCQDDLDVYPMLSEITTWDIERFLPEHMDNLIFDLKKLKKSLVEKHEVSYIDDLIHMCERCQDNNEGWITVDPFGDLVKIGTKETKQEL